MIRTAFNGLSFIFAGVLLLVFAAVLYLFPSWYWMDVRSVRVFDAKVGEPILMAVDRTISRDFPGLWVVSLRQNQGGKWETYCTANGAANYQADSYFPDPLTLQWWAHPGCRDVGDGEFVMRTSWEIRTPFFPTKIITVDSNIFRITR